MLEHIVHKTQKQEIWLDQYKEWKAKGNPTLVTLDESEYEKDFGVLIDNTLGFSNHVAHVTTKANRIDGIIHRTFDFLSEELFVQLRLLLGLFLNMATPHGNLIQNNYVKI